jgi:hypothetical protein
MENTPQPSNEPYSPGDEVRVYLAKDDPDRHHHHDAEGVVTEKIEDSLAEAVVNRQTQLDFTRSRIA